MDCLYCGKKDIPMDWSYCSDCGVNIKDYEKAVKFIKQGEEFEANFEYDAARESYKEVLAFNYLQDKIVNFLARVTKKEQEIIDILEQAEEAFDHHHWRKAIHNFEKVCRLNPSLTDEVKEKLIKSRHLLARLHKRKGIWITCLIILVSAIAVGRWIYLKTPAQIAHRTIKNGIISADMKEKLAAIESAGRLQEKTLLPFLKDAIRDPHAVIRVAAVKSLGQLKDTSVTSLLKECLADRNWEVRIEAAQSLALLGDSSGIEVLRKAIE
ncbi:MAG: HEAT repeat domain-containing protein [Candidatus Stahlbacteria bacterium]|nr:HEAT repeat domain-containing protein [Candidatus Stahlbacteria bacterium]